MNRQERRSRGKLVDIRKLHPVWVRAVAGLAAVVMFCTVYALILPAAAITGAEATEEIGFYREETGEPDTIAADLDEGVEPASSEEKDLVEESLETPETEEQTSKVETQAYTTENQTPVVEEQTSKTEDQTAEAADQATKSTEETTEQTTEHTAEQTAESVSDKSSEQTSEQSSEQTSELSVDQSAEQESSEEETSEDEEAEAVFKEGELTYQGEDYTVTLTYGEDAKIPEKAFLKVEELTEGDAYENCLKEAAETVEKKEQELHARLFDITICAENEDGEDEEIQPAGAVRVSIAYDEAVKLPEDAEMQVVHLAAEKSEEENSVLDVETEGKGAEVEGVAFDAEHFSVFVVMYTVDFSYSVDGETYYYSIPGGGYISLRQLVELFGIGRDEDTENETSEADGKTLTDMEISDWTTAFVDEVEKAEFSSPELIWIGKVEENCTVGELKATNGLECQYSANLTEDQIEEINTQTIESGDWALISLQPFTSNETLTITMKNGNQFVVNVTDEAPPDPSTYLGKEIIIYDNTEKQAMTSNYATDYRTHFNTISEATADGDQSARWTIQQTTGGYYLLSSEGKYLYLDHTNVRLVDTASEATVLTIQVKSLIVCKSLILY